MSSAPPRESLTLRRTESLPSALGQTLSGIYARPADAKHAMDQRRQEYEGTMQDYERMADDIMADKSLSSEMERRAPHSDAICEKLQPTALWQYLIREALTLLQVDLRDGLS